MKKIILSILSILLILSKSQAGIDAFVTFNTNNFTLNPTNLWRTNVKAMEDALTNDGFSTGGGSGGLANVTNAAAPLTLVSLVTNGANVTLSNAPTTNDSASIVGTNNSIYAVASGFNSAVLAGQNNSLGAGTYIRDSVLLGGASNTIYTGSSAAPQRNSAIVGGQLNLIEDSGSAGHTNAGNVILGGFDNSIAQLFENGGITYSTILGGFDNVIGSSLTVFDIYSSTILGGTSNLIGASAVSGTGGVSNSIAAGVQAQVTNNNTFEFNDGTAGPLASSNDDTFIVHALNGISLSSTNLTISSNMTASGNVVNFGRGTPAASLATQDTASINTTNLGQASLNLTEGGSLMYDFESSAGKYGYASIWNNLALLDQLLFYTNLSSKFNGALTVKSNLTAPSWNSNIWWIAPGKNGVVGDGVTDDTAAIQALLNLGGTFQFSSNRFYSQELFITNNSILHLNGATLIYATGAANTNIFVTCGLNTNISIIGPGQLEGGHYPDITTNTFVTFNGTASFATALNYFSYWSPRNLRHGLQANVDAGGDVRGITVRGFNGCGIIPLSGVYTPGDFGSTDYTQKKTVFQGINVSTNTVGIFSSALLGNQEVGPAYSTNFITNYPGIPINAGMPEYVHWTDCTLTGNTIGADISSGNTDWLGCNFSGNYIAAASIFGNNSIHGTIVDCFFNHNLGQSLHFIGNNLSGELIKNCWFAGGNPGSYGITFDGCAGIKIEGCFFATIAITNINTTSGNKNYFEDNSYQSTWASQFLNTDGLLVISGNTSANVANDTDGSPASALAMGLAPTLQTSLNVAYNLNVGQQAVFSNTVTFEGIFSDAPDNFQVNQSGNVLAAQYTATDQSITGNGFVGNGGGLTNDQNYPYTQISPSIALTNIWSNSTLSRAVVMIMMSNTAAPARAIWYVYGSNNVLQYTNVWNSPASVAVGQNIADLYVDPSGWITGSNVLGTCQVAASHVVNQ